MVKKLSSLLVLVAVFFGQAHAATLDGAPPPFGSSVNEVRNDDVLEKGELHKRASFSVAISNPVSVNAIVGTSISVPKSALFEGLNGCFVAGATITAAPTYQQDALAATTLRNSAGALLGAGDIISGTQYCIRYGSATSQWRITSGLAVASGGGTVTSTSVVSANGFTGTVATATTTPAITLSTSVTGLVKGNGAALSAAASGTDYSLGTSGNATGIVKSTAGTGALSTAIAADFPTLNQSTTGNASTVTTNANLTGPITSIGNATAIASQTGTGSKFVVDTSPTLITPNLGTPSVGVLTNATGLPTTGLTGTLAAAQFPALTGDVTTTAGALGATIPANTVTNAKAAQMATLTIKGNNTGATANATDLTVANVNTMINSTVAPLFANITSRPNTLSGYGINDAEGTFTSTTAVSAAGSTQGTATAITKTSGWQLFEVTTVAASQGVVLPTSTASARAVLVNRGANALSIYPASTGTIDGGTASAPITLGVNQAISFVAKDASNNWYTVRGATYNATAPPALGTASVGASNDFARADHVHPAADLSGAQVTGTLAAARLGTFTGDVTTPGSSYAALINANVVDNTKLAQIATQTFKGRTTAATGNVEDLTIAQAKTMLALTGTNTGDQTITLTGDVTGSGIGSFASTINSGTVTLAKMANLAANSVIANNTGSSATPTALAMSPLAVASTVALRDSNANEQTNNLRQGFTTTATAGATTTLTVASPHLEFFTGTLAQTVTLPDVTTLVLGHQFYIRNSGTGILTINSSGGNLVRTIGPGTRAIVTCTLATGTTAASWSSFYAGISIADGKVLTVNNNLTLAGTDATTMTFPTTSATIARTDAANTFAGVQAMTSPAITGLPTGSGVASAATASTLAARDASGNLSANVFLPNYATTATAAGTTTLTVTSAQLQYFTGATTQTVVLPVTSTLALGFTYTVVNNSSGAVQVQSSGANNILSVAAGNTGYFTVILTSGTTSASWSNTYISSGSGTGTVTSVTCGTGLGGGTFTTTGTCTVSPFTSTTAVSAAGTTQGTATALSASASGSDLKMFEVTTVTTASAEGVVLPTSTADMRFTIVNRGAGILKIYPASTGTIDGGTASAAITVASGDTAILSAKDTSNNWFVLGKSSVFGPGTATKAPLTIVSGTLNTTAQAGAVEYDGTVVYGSMAASTRGAIPSVQYTILNAPYTLAPLTVAQKLFNASPNGAVTLPIGEYKFKCIFALASMSATSGSFGFALGGTATFTQAWQSLVSKPLNLASTSTTNLPILTYNTVANSALTAANTNGTGIAIIEGTIKVTVAGTLIPQVLLGSAAAAIVQTGSSFEIWAVNPSASGVTVGNWN